MIIIECEQRSESWYQARLGRFTASNFSSVMSKPTTSVYKNLISCVAGEIITNEIEESYQNDAMLRGIELEPIAAKEYESVFGDVDEVGFCIPDEEDMLHEWVGVSPDRMQDNGLIEIKCPLIKTHLEYIKQNKLPNEYKWQVQGQLMVTGLDYCDFMSYYPKLKPFIIRIYPDLEMHNELRERFEIAIQDVKNILNFYDSYNYLDEIK